MNKQKAIERLDALEAEAKELRKIIDEPEKEKEPWDFEDEGVWVNYVTFVEDDPSTDEWNLNGRELPQKHFTKAQATKAFARMNALCRLEQLAAILNDGWEPDDDEARWWTDCRGGVCEFTFPSPMTEFKTQELAEKAWSLLTDEQKAALRYE